MSPSGLVLDSSRVQRKQGFWSARALRPQDGNGAKHSKSTVVVGEQAAAGRESPSVARRAKPQGRRRWESWEIVPASPPLFALRVRGEINCPGSVVFYNGTSRTVPRPPQARLVGSISGIVVEGEARRL